MLFRSKDILIHDNSEAFENLQLLLLPGGASSQFPDGFYGVGVLPYSFLSFIFLSKTE